MSWFPKDRIVVPVDFSDDSFAAVKVAVSLARSPSGVHLVHVLHDIAAVEPGEVWLTVDHEARRRHADLAIQERLAKEQISGVTVHITLGDPGHEIADYAQENSAELIVMPSHGRSGIKRLLLGSVTERTLRLAHCPILVLRK
jgi:nucleotide-binding universal stress UspA family protein